MEQLRQLGEAVRAINARMAFEPELRVNPRQCRLRADACAHALAAVTECLEQHLHDILWCVAVAVEAVEAAAEIAGDGADEIALRRVVLANKYDGRSMLKPRMLQHAYGKVYLVS